MCQSHGVPISAGLIRAERDISVIAPHAAEVDAALGSGSWRRGAGVFASFFALSDGDESGSGSGGSSSSDRVAALADLADALRSSCSSSSSSSSFDLLLPATSPRDASRLSMLRGSARGDIAAQLAKWLLRCSGGSGNVEEQGSSLARLAERAVAAASLPALRSDERAGVLCAAAAALAGIVA